MDDRTKTGLGFVGIGVVGLVAAFAVGTSEGGQQTPSYRGYRSTAGIGVLSLVMVGAGVAILFDIGPVGLLLED